MERVQDKHAAASTRGVCIAIGGQVQGVGFRPYVCRLARAHGVTGSVRNELGGVAIRAFGTADRLADFLRRIREELPPSAAIRTWHAQAVPFERRPSFVIDQSSQAGPPAWSLPADRATCAACLVELDDPKNRRFGYPFINCTACGPRFTIATGLPYDRDRTTMRGFALCAACQREYADPEDRRFHAEATACPRCGPRLQWHARPGGGRAIPEAAALLRQGKAIALKGLGGFHLVCDARSSAAVAGVRQLKRRERKPLAVMVQDVSVVRSLAYVSAAEERLLAAPERPIVLLYKRPDHGLSPEVCGEAATIGVFLPYTPLHHLLLRAVERPLVMTSANHSGQPMMHRDEDVLALLQGPLAGVLAHDRPIAVRTDDSVVRMVDGVPILLRRGRGYVPEPIPLATPVSEPVLACGGHLKNTFCIAVDDLAYVSPHIGDLDSPEMLAWFEEAIGQAQDMLGVEPAIIVHDFHPNYVSTHYARARCAGGVGGPRAVAVQHHHAHVAAAMAEHGLVGPVLGLAYDGTGLGLDGTAWGGEVLLADYGGFVRLGAFRPLPLPGGERAITEVWRAALALLMDAFDGDPPLSRLALFEHVPSVELARVRQLLQRGVCCPGARGVGRLFDAFGAMCLGRPQAYYEGEVAQAFGDLARAAPAPPYPFAVAPPAAPCPGGPVLEIDLRPAVRAAVVELCAGTPACDIATRFHHTLAAAGVALLGTLPARERSAAAGLPAVLSGGCFQNPVLSALVSAALSPHHRVYRHQAVPPGDGGLSLGQAVVGHALSSGHLPAIRELSICA